MKRKNLNRSRAMKESWAKRRNSPGRQMQREREAKERADAAADAADARLQLADTRLPTVRSLMEEMKRQRKVIDARFDEIFRQQGTQRFKNKGVDNRFNELCDGMRDLRSKLEQEERHGTAIHDAVREIETKLRVRPMPSLRRAIATCMLQGMLSSVPIADRTKVKANVWAKKAYEFADALIAVENVR